MESAVPTYRAWLWGLALFGATLDQATKYGVFHALYNDGAGDRQALIPGAFDLLTQFTHQQENGTGVLAQLRTVSGDTLPRVNHGALFGMGSTTEGLANTLFAVVSFIAALAILYWSTRPTLARDRWLCIALGLILGGTLGNLYDRIVFGGVRDFLHWYYWVDWPVFNIADCCLVCGAGLLLVQALFRPAPATEEITNKEEVVAV